MAAKTGPLCYGIFSVCLAISTIGNMPRFLVLHVMGLKGAVMARLPKVLYGIILVFALSASLMAEGVLRDSVGARSAGRGGTDIAFADTGAILLDNPAGMVNIEGQGMAELGFDFLFTDLRYSDPDNRLVNAWDNPLPLPYLSLIRKSADGCWAYGLGVFAPSGMAVDWDMAGPAPFVGSQHYKTLGALGKILPGVSFALNDRLSIGGTFGLALSHIEMQGPYFLQSPGPFQGTPLKLGVYDTGVAPTWSAGLQYQLSDKTTLGLSYQSETCVNMDGSARFEVPLMGISEYNAHMRMIWPQTAGIGIRHEICPERIISADIVWAGWWSAFNKFDLNFDNPSNPVYAAVIGPGIAEQFPLGWRDAVSLRLGYEKHFENNHIVRIGYVYHRSPVPNETLTPFMPNTLVHAFSAGYGWTTQKCWNIDLAYQFAFGPENRVGRSDFIGNDFDNSVYQVQAHWLSVSLMKKF
jgi:long-chain fatty acid transport protein